jgi:hypothetical protein
MKLKEKRRAASQLRWWDMKLRGMKRRRILSQDPKTKNLNESVYEGSSSALMAALSFEKNDGREP